MKVSARAIIAACMLQVTLCANASLIPQFFTDCVVALGGKQVIPPARPGDVPHEEWQTVGTGFFYGYLVKDDADPTKREYQVFLVTARHVVEGYASGNQSPLRARLNGRDKLDGQEFETSSAVAAWSFHSNQNIDVAILPVDLGVLREKGLEHLFFASDLHAADTRKLKELEVTAGDGIFVLGFPMNLAGKQRNYVIVRSGVIARLSELLDGASEKYMIDGFVFPGNSGGPVILKPEAMSITGTKSHSSAYLVGIVLSYQPYIDYGISPQTKRARITFEENSGLADVLPTDFIDEAIRERRDSDRLKAKVK